MTSVDLFDEETPLFTHTCACCGDPIAARHEIICEAILAIDAMDNGANIDGEFTTIYCPACLIEVLDFSAMDDRDAIRALMEL